jgi:hypothetical protein
MDVNGYIMHIKEAMQMEMENKEEEIEFNNI